MNKITSNEYGYVEGTLAIACTDIAQGLTNTQLQNDNGNFPVMCEISAEGNNVRFAFGVDPTQGADGSGAVGRVLYAADSYRILNARNIQTLRFINATNGNNAYLQVNMFYEVGK